MSLWQAYWHTLKECCINISCAPFFLLAIAFYAFYYCWPYTAQMPWHLPASIVDEDNSHLSREIVRAIHAIPELNTKFVTANRREGIAAMQSEEIVALIGIPPNFEKNVLAGIPTALTLVGDGAFIVKSKSSISGASGVLAAISMQAMEKQLLQRGIPLTQIKLINRQVPALTVQPMYNYISGYMNFAVPIVFMVIFQVLMVCGTSMLLNSWQSLTKLPEQMRLALNSPLYLLAIQMPVCSICFFWTLAVEGAIFGLHGINSFQNISSTILMGLCLSLAISSLAIVIALLFRKSHFAIQTMVISALPCVFISGNLFPLQNIPLPMRLLAWFLPSSPGSSGMLRASQSGANIMEVMPYLLHLLILFILYYSLALVICLYIRKEKLLK